MALPSSGSISISQIKTELGLPSINSLAGLSNAAQLGGPPYPMSHFYGYSNGLVLNLDAANSSSYPGSGTTWYDISGNGNHFNMAAYNGGSNPSIAGSGSGQYFQFTGTYAPAASYQGGGYFTRGASLNMNYSTTITWFNNNTYSPKVMILGGTGYNSSMYQGVELFLNGYAIGYVSSRISTGQGFSYNDINTSYNYNTWYMLAQTYDGTTQKMYLQMNVQSVSKTGTQNTPDKNYMIGAHHTSSGNPGEFYNGAISVYKVWNRALSFSEINDQYNLYCQRYGYNLI